MQHDMASTENYSRKKELQTQSLDRRWLDTLVRHDKDTSKTWHEYVA